MAEELGILISAELDKKEFETSIDAQLKSLQDALKGKSLKIKVGIDDSELGNLDKATSKLKQGIKDVNKEVGNIDIGNSLDVHIKKSIDKMDELKKSTNEAKKALKGLEADEKHLLKTEKERFNQQREASALGQAKKAGLRMPKKGDPEYDYWQSVTDTKGRKQLTSNGYVKSQSANGKTFSDFAKEKGLDPKTFMDELSKGFKKFDESMINEETLKSLEDIRAKQKKRLETIKEENTALEKENKTYKDLIDMQNKSAKNGGKLQEEEIKRLKEIDAIRSKINADERLQNAKTGNYKLASSAETVNPVTKKVTGRIDNEEDQYGNKKITRYVKDNNNQLVPDSVTEIKNIKKVEEALDKYGLKYEKWNDRIQALNNKTNKMGDKDLGSINNMTKQLNEMDSTTNKITFDRFENELKKLEKEVNANLKSFDALEKQKEKLSKQATGMSKGNLIDNKMLDEYKQRISSIDSTDEKSAKKAMDNLKDELELRKKVNEAHSKGIKENAKLDADRVKEQEKLEKKKLETLDRITKAELKGKTDPAKAEEYRSIVNGAKLTGNQKAVDNEDIKNVQKYLKELDNMKLKETNVIDTKERLDKKLKNLVVTNKMATAEMKEFSKSIDATESVQELDKIEKKINKVIKDREYEQKMSARKTYQTPMEGFTGIGNVTDRDIQNSVKLNEELGNRAIIGTRVNRVTGEWTARIQESGTQERELRGTIDRTTGALTRQSDVIQDTTNRNLGFIEQFRIALERVPIWAGAMTMIYGTQHALEDMVRVIVEVDSQMTELKRVMNEETDFNYMLKESIDMSKELGNVLTDVNKAVIGFARQGFDGQESLDMGKTAIIASNVSDMTADETMSDLTAIMTQFNIQASESIQIVDKLNEVDNNFAITTRDLADATSKAGATAQTFGVGLDEMIGQVTAIGVATRESGSVIGNSLKSIYSRITTVPESVEGLKEIGISVKDASGEMRSAKDILDELHGKWGNLSKAQQQNLSVSIAGRQQLSRFLALMNNYQMSLDATSTALTSEGSAMRENEKYMDSMQAQINKLKVAWYELSISFGENIIGGAFIGIVKGLTGLADGVTFLSEHIGTLPLILGLVSTAVLVLTGRFTAFNVLSKSAGASILAFGKSCIDGTLMAKGLTMAVNGLARAMAFLKTALGGFLITGAIMLVGYALEALIGKYRETVKEQKEFEKQQNQIANSMMNHEDKINGLIKEYDELSNKVNMSTEEKEKYKSVQNDLAKLMPNFVKKIDAEGNAHLKNVDAIKKEIKYSKELAEAKKNENVANAGEKFDKEIKDRDKLIKKIKDTQDAQKNFKNEDGSFGGNSVRTLGLGEGDVGYEQAVKEAEQNWRALETQRIALENQLEQMEGTVRKSVKKMVKDLMELSKPENFDIKEALKDTNKLLGKMSDDALAKINKQEGGLDLFAGKLSNAIMEYKKQMNEGVSVGALAESEAVLRKLLEDTKELSDTDIDMYIYDLNHTAEAVEKVNDKLLDHKSIIEDMTNTYNDVKDSISTYNKLLEDSAEGKGMTATEAIDLIMKENDLAKAITIENGAIEVNTEMVKQLRDTKNTAFSESMKQKREEMNAEANKVRATLKNTGLELKAIKSLADAKANYNKVDTAIDDEFAGGQQLGSEYMKQLQKAKERYGDYIEASEAIDNLIAMMETSLNEVGTVDETMDSREKDAKEKAEEYNKAMEQKIFITNKYEHQLAKVNAQIAKHNRLQDQLLKHSKRYQLSLKQEYEWLREKGKILKTQANDLYKQIQSGNIKQYGLVSIGDLTGAGGNGVSANTSGTYTGQGAKKTYSGKYDSIINEASRKYGVNPNLIAGMIRQESNFNPNARSGVGATGLMQLMPFNWKPNGVSNPYDPKQNIMGGTKMIAELLKKYNGNIEKALYAYNAGSGNVNKILNSGKGSWKEPKDYYKKVTGYMNGYGGGTAYGTSRAGAGATQASSSGGFNPWQYYTKTLGLQITSRFNQKEAFRKNGHKGLDMSNGKSGDLIKAVKGGKVITANWSSSAGNWVVIQQDDGTVGKYMHMKKKPLVKAGQRVEVGQGLGYIGNTGDVQKGNGGQGNHLHYQVEKNGKPIDPEAYMKNLKTTSGQISQTIGDSEAEIAQAIDQANLEYMNQAEAIRENEKAMADLKHEIIMSYTYPFDEAIHQQEVVAERYQLGTYHMITSSKQYRGELEKERKALIEKQKIIQDEDAEIRNLMKTTQMGEKTRYELQEKLNELNRMKYANAEARDQITWQIIQSEVEQYQKTIENLNYALAKNSALQKNVNQNSKEYSKLLKEQIKLTNDQRKAILEQVNVLEKSLYTQAMTLEQKEEIRNQIQELMKEYYNLGSSIEDVKSTLADKAIETLKKAYEKQKELAIKAIDAELKEAEKAHDKKMKMLDDEMEAYEKQIQLKLREYDDQISKDQYDKNMAKMQKEELELQKKIDILSLDNSQDAIAKRLELEEQLKQKKEEIEQAKYDREMELKKQALQDELDRKKEEVEDAKEKEQDKYDDLVDAKEEEKELIESTYEEIMANEKYWADLRKDLINGNVEEMEKALEQFLGKFGEYNEETVKGLKSTWTELQSLIDDIKSSMGDMGQIGDMGGSNGGDGGLDIDADQRVKDWQKYLSNKRKYDKATTKAERDKYAKENASLRDKWGFVDGHWAELEKVDIGAITNNDAKFQQKMKDWYQYLHNKKIYDKSSYAEKQKLMKANAEFRKKWGFPDGKIEDLDKMQLHDDGRIYHKGGIVGGKGNSSLGKVLDTLANTKPNEQMVKALKGELFIPEKNFPNFITNTTKAILGNLPQGGTIVQPNNVEVNVNVENLNGTKKDAESLASVIANKLKKSGVL